MSVYSERRSGYRLHLSASSKVQAAGLAESLPEVRDVTHIEICGAESGCYVVNYEGAPIPAGWDKAVVSLARQDRELLTRLASEQGVRLIGGTVADVIASTELHHAWEWRALEKGSK